MSSSRSDNPAKRWSQATTLREMAECLAGIGSERKFRLLTCAAIRRLWPLALDPRTQATVEQIERYADGLATAAELQAAVAYEAYIDARGLNHDPAVANAAYCAALLSPPHQLHEMALTVLEDCRAACRRNSHLGFDPVQELQIHERMMRCVFGHVFRESPTQLDVWRAWNGGTIVQLARAFYELPSERLSWILADALEEAGCADEAILSHCRDEEPHVRGCWVVDLLLGKS